MIELIDINKSFGKKNGRVIALNGINLFVSKGEMIAIMGKSGSGKSTLINIIGGLVMADSGEYWFNGELMNIKNRKELTLFRRNQIGFIIQDFALVDELNVYQNIAIPLIYRGCSKKEIKDKIINCLKQLDMEDKIKAYPFELSGGERQRVAIARAMVKEPEIILADEPTGALDEYNGKNVMQILRRLNNYGITIIIVTHDKSIADKCDRIISISDGKNI